MISKEEARRRLERLSEREWEVLKRRAQGMSLQAIAIALQVTKSTISEHAARTNIKLELDQIDDKKERLYLLQTVYYPLVREIGDWPGRKLPPARLPLAIIPVTPKALIQVVDDEDDSDDRNVIDGEIVQRTELQVGRTGRQLQLPVPAGRQGIKRSSVALAFLLGIAVMGAIGVYAVSSGRLSNILPLAPPVEITHDVEVTRLSPITITQKETQIFVTPGQAILITTTSEPTSTPPPSPLPLPTLAPLLIPAPTDPNQVMPTAQVKLQPLSNVASEPNPVRIGDAQTGFASPWRWLVGSSRENSYRFDDDPNSVTIIAGQQTQFAANIFSGPSIARPISDAIDLRARIDFDPKEPFQVAGLSIHVTQDPSTWVTVRRYSDNGAQWIEANSGQGGGWTMLTQLPFASHTTYLRLIHQNEFITIAVSDNGRNWITLKRNYLWQFSGPTEMRLYAYSTTSSGIPVRISNISMSLPGHDLDVETTGNVPFMTADAPDQLSSAWGYFPGGNAASSYRIAQSKLVLIAASGTRSIDGNHSAPFVALPVSGDFTAQVKVEFEPHENFHVAGFSMWSGEEPSKFVSLRRWSDGSNQFVDAVQGGSVGNRPISNPNQQNYADKIVYFRIDRTDALITLAYSADGKVWTELAHEFIMEFTDPLQLMLYVWSSAPNGISATFSDVSIVPK